MVRLPNLCTRIHASSVAGCVGLVPFVVAAATAGIPAIIHRAIQIAAFLLLTPTVATQAIAHAAHPRGAREEPPGHP